MNDQNLKTDCNGWKYYDRLPNGYRPGSMDDFHVRGKKKVGMEYLIQRADQPHFEIHKIMPQTRAINLKPFLDWNMIFVKET